MTAVVINHRYQLVNKITEDLTGTFYSACDHLTGDERVIVKLLRGDMVSGFQEDKLQFTKTAERVMQLVHPRIIRLLALGGVDSVDIRREIDFLKNPYCLIMEYFSGESLSDFFKRGYCFTEKEIVKIITEAAEGLRLIHNMNLIHASLTPEKIILRETMPGQPGNGYSVSLTETGVASIMDFSSVKDPDVLSGIFGYQAPEQSGVLKHPSGPVSDLYSLGIIFYHLLTGTKPYKGHSLPSIMHRHVALEPVRPGSINKSIHKVLEKIVLKLMMKDPVERYQTAGELIHDLENFRNGNYDLVVTSKPGRKNLKYNSLLVQRDYEINSLKKIYKESPGGKKWMALIHGKAGSGKTRLVREFEYYVKNCKGKMLYAKCAAAYQSLPYAPVNKLFSQYIQKYEEYSEIKKKEINEEFRNSLGILGQVVLKLNRGMEKVIGSYPDLVALDSDKERARFILVIKRFLHTLSALEPGLVLVIDDLQWADEGSLFLFNEIIPELEALPLFFIGVFRDEELDDNHLEMIKKLKKFALLNLQILPFEKNGFNRFIANLLESPPEDTLPGSSIPIIADIIYKKSLGNPFFSIEILKHLVETGGIVFKEGSWFVDRKKTASINIPGSVIGIISRHISWLNGDERKLLSYASCVGNEFNVRFLVDLALFNEDIVRRCLLKAEDLQLVEREGCDTCCFVHDKIKETFCFSLTREERKLIHLRIGNMLEKNNKHNMNEILFKLIYHFMEAGEKEKVLLYSYPAILKAKQTHAYSAAVELIEKAIGLLEPGERIPLKVDIMKEYGEVLLVTGEYDRAIEIYNTLLAHITDKETEAVLHGKRALAYLKKGNWVMCEFQAGKALRLIGERLPVTRVSLVISFIREAVVQFFFVLTTPFIPVKKKEISRKTEILIDIFSHLGWMYSIHSKAKFVRLMLRLANIARSRTGDSRELGMIYRGFAMTFSCLSFFKLAMRYHKKSMAQLRGSKHISETAQSLQFIGATLAWWGKKNKALKFLKHSIKKYEKIGDIWSSGMSIYQMAICYYFTSSYPEARTCSEKLLEISRKSHDLHGLANAYILLGRIYTDMGEPGKALEYLSKIDEDIRKRYDDVDGEIHIQTGIIKYEQKDFESALLFFGKAASIYKKINFQDFIIHFHPYRAEVLLLDYKNIRAASSYHNRRKKRKEIRKLCRLAMAKTKKWPNHYGAALRVNAEFFALEGKTKRALTCFRKSIEYNEKQGRRYEQGISCYVFSLFLRDNKMRNEAVFYLTKAYNLFKEIGSKIYMRKTADMLGINRTVSMANTRLMEEQKLSSIMKVSQDISSILDLEKLLECIMDKAIEVTGAEQGYLFLSDEPEGELSLKARKKIDESSIDAIRFSGEITRQVYTTKKTVIIKERREQDNGNIKSVLCIPVEYQNRVSGVAYFANSLSGGIFTRREADLLTVFMTQAAICIENALVYGKLKEREKESKEFNLSLEKRVKERTVQLERAKSEIEEVTRQKTDFFVNLAHEVKTPLTLINNYFDQYVKKNGKSRELSIIKANLDRLTGDMISFLDTEKIRRGETVYENNNATNFTSLLLEKLPLFKAYAARKKIRIYEKIDQEIYVKADPLALDRIINNLLENAVKYSDQPGVIHVVLEIENHKVAFVVSDKGIGISRQQVKNVFIPYHHLPYSTSKRTGMGMGLYIVQTAVNSLNGKIEVESEPGKGSLFKVILPPCPFPWKAPRGREAVVDIAASHPRVRIAEKMDRNFYKVLVVEDNDQLMDFLSLNLGKDFELFCAENGKTAIRLLSVIPKPDIIVSDIMMDEMDGYMLCEEIQKQPLLKDIPFLFLSAKNSQAERLKGISMGALDYISKPFNLDELIAKINSILVMRERQVKADLNQIEAKVMEIFKKKRGNNGRQEQFDRKCDQYNITQREKQIIMKVKQGLENKQIAGDLGVSINTIKNHIRSIYEKCNVQNRVELINWMEM